MLGVNSSRIFVQSAQEVDRAAKVAMENISKQLAKMPPVKKPASAADNFPWIYDNVPKTQLIVSCKKTTADAIKELSKKVALNAYKTAG